MSPADPHPGAPAPPLPPGDAASSADARIGTTIAQRYQLTEKLGEGAMGVVYAAEHLALRKKVAVKLMHREMTANSEAVARFEREGIAAASFDHPNIAAAMDFGRLPDGSFFLVMEFVEGRSLRRVLDEDGRLPPARVVRILAQVASALARAHGLGVVHRDLKPENIIVADRDEERDVAKVIDFGLARVANTSFGMASAALTQVGAVFGTPAYMSPEQAMGQRADPRADQYALGVIAFEMFAGRRPFDAPDPIDLLHLHMAGPIPKLSTYLSEASPALDAALTKMLAKVVAERFENVTRAMDAIDAAVRALPPRPAAPAPQPFAQTAVGAPSAAQVLGPAAGAMAPSPGAAPASAASLPRPSLTDSPAGSSASSVTHAPSAVPSLPAGPSLGQRAITGINRLASWLDADPRRRKQVLAVTLGAGAVLLLILLIAVLRTPSRDATHAAGPAGAGRPSAPGASAASRGPGDATQPLAERMAAYAHEPEIARALSRSFRGDTEGAVLVLRGRTNRNPRDGLARYYLGTVYSGARRMPEAVAEFRESLQSEPGLAEDATLVHTLTAALGEPAAAEPAEAVLRAAPMSASSAASEALADAAIDASSADARTRALRLLRARNAALSPLVGARVRLRDAENCAELQSALDALGAMSTEATADDVRRVRAGDCRMLQRRQLCRECNPH